MSLWDRLQSEMREELWKSGEIPDSMLRQLKSISSDEHQKERRAIDVKHLEIRGEGEDTKLYGYIAVYNQRTLIVDFFWEIIRPGAFRRSLEPGADVVLDWQHKDEMPFARTTSGTLKLFDDDFGLRFEATPVNAQWAKDAIASIRRGDVTGGSFFFIVPEGGDKWSEGEVDGRPMRELVDVDVRAGSIVTYPQYTGAMISARSMTKVAEIRSKTPGPSVEPEPDKPQKDEHKEPEPKNKQESGDGHELEVLKMDLDIALVELDLEQGAL